MNLLELSFLYQRHVLLANERTRDDFVEILVAINKAAG